MEFITEPATLATDYLLAAFTAVLAWRLKSGGAPQRWWAAGLAASGVAGMVGGTVHGFARVLPEPVIRGLWILTLEMLGVAALAVIMATLATTPLLRRVRILVVAAVYIALAAYGVIVPARPLFGVAIAAYGCALSALAVVEAWRWWSRRARASVWLLGGVLLSALAATVQQSGWALHQYFNNNDVFHVVQAGAIWLLYRGASLSTAASHAPRSGE